MSGSEPELAVLGSGSTLKSCAVCGQRFSCGAPATGCWCEDLQVTREVLRELRARYADCLCRRCLSAAALSAECASHADSESNSTAPNILPQYPL